MSVIMPVGKNSNDWSLEGLKNGLNKTASTGVEVKSERDTLYDAAQKSITDSQKKKACVNSIADGLSVEKPEDKSGMTEVTDMTNVPSVTDVKPEEVGKEVSVSEKIEKVEKALDEVEVAIADVKDAVAPASDVTDTTDVAKDVPVDEVEIELDNVNDKPENTDEKPFEKKDKEIIVESKDDEKKPECKETEEMKTRAAANTWQKFSGVSKETRNKIYDYYVNCLGYPKDYVALLVKNYEK